MRRMGVYWLFAFFLLVNLTTATRHLQDGPRGESKICYRGKECKPLYGPDTTQDIGLHADMMPLDLSPYHYNIELVPDIYRAAPPFPFDGYVEVYFEVLTATDVVVLNQAELVVDSSSISIEVVANSPIQPPQPVWQSYEEDNNLQFFTLHLDQNMAVGAWYVVKLAFTGVLGSSTWGGIFYTTYEVNNQTRYIMGTQFEACWARYAFPCFDEPRWRATHNVSLSRMAHMSSLSPMPVAVTEDLGNGWFKDVFETTVSMTSYHLAFVISDFQYVQTINPNGVVTRVWASAEYLYAAAWASEVAGPILEWYELYTGIDYPMPKLDHVYLPGFSGAMENWGLIIYADYYLLYDPAWGTTSNKLNVAAVIAHEVSHMWWGNLVTCQWFDHIWLNEGFASHFETPPLEDILGWQWREMQVTDTINPMLIRDQRNTSDPVRIDIPSPGAADGSFTSAAYSKGAAVVRMIGEILGDASLKRAMNRYLTTYSYQSIGTDELWDILTLQATIDGITDTDGSSLDFKQKMDPWIEQMGYPMITLTRDPGGNIAHFNQHHHLNPPNQDTGISPWLYRWYVPITFYTEEYTEWNTSTRDWINLAANKTLTDYVPNGRQEWMMVNTLHSGFLRVAYDDLDRDAINQQMRSQHEDFNSENRCQYLRDTYEVISIGGGLREVDAFECTRYLGKEYSFCTWLVATQGMDYSALMFARYPTTYDAFQAYIRGEIDAVYGQLGWTPDVDETDIATERLRDLILWLACTYGNAGCILESRQQYNEWMLDVNTNPIKSDYRYTVYCTAIRTGAVSDWDFAHSAYLLTTASNHLYASDEKDNLLFSMACSDDTATLQRYISYTFDDAMIIPADRIRAFRYMSTAHAGRNVVWEHLKLTWADTPTPPTVSKHDVLEDVVSGFVTSADYQELQDFITMYPAVDEAEEEVYNSSLATVEANNAWAADNQQEVEDWLLANAPKVALPYNTVQLPPGNHGLKIMYEKQKWEKHAADKI